MFSTRWRDQVYWSIHSTFQKPLKKNRNRFFLNLLVQVVHRLKGMSRQFIDASSTGVAKQVPTSSIAVLGARSHVMAFKTVVWAALKNSTCSIGDAGMGKIAAWHLLSARFVVLAPNSGQLLDLIILQDDYNTLLYKKWFFDIKPYNSQVLKQWTPLIF